jgi:hypothetical protein
MAKVKILLEKGETELDADQALQKALEFHSSGDAHDEETFEDPAMVHMSGRMEEIGQKIYAEMVREIQDVLDKEYSHGGE